MDIPRPSNARARKIRRIAYNDFIEAHEITDKRQILAIACLIRVCEGSRNDVPEFSNIAHVDATRICIKRKSPAHGSVTLLLGSQSAQKVLVVERCDDERMIRETCFLDHPINSERRVRALLGARAIKRR